MKNRSWICYALDICGLVGLIGAFLALGSALWFQASVAEAILFTTFQYCLMASVAGFLAARMVEIADIMQRAPAAEIVDVAPVTHLDNVESLPERSELPRAA